MDALAVYRAAGLLTLSDMDDFLLLSRFVGDQGHLRAAAAYYSNPRGSSYSNHPDRARVEALLEFIDLYEDKTAFASWLRFQAPAILAQIKRPQPASPDPGGPLPF